MFQNVPWEKEQRTGFWCGSFSSPSLLFERHAATGRSVRGDKGEREARGYGNARRRMPVRRKVSR
jgi:hypothetical protein